MAIKLDLRVKIRWLVESDYPVVADIERQCFHDHPWSEADFRRCNKIQQYILVVAEYEEKVIGYLVYSLEREEFGITNLAVAPEFQRQGVAGQLVQYVTDRITPHNRVRVVATVHEENLPMQLFLKDFGFEAVKVLRGEYDDGSDGYLFSYDLSEELP